MKKKAGNYYEAIICLGTVNLAITLAENSEKCIHAHVDFYLSSYVIAFLSLDPIGFRVLAFDELVGITTIICKHVSTLNTEEFLDEENEICLK